MNNNSYRNKKSFVHLKQVVKLLSQHDTHLLSCRSLGWLTGSTLLLFAASTSPVAAQTQTTIVNETFRNSTAFGWDSSNSKGPNLQPSCLTAAGTSPSGGALSNLPNCGSIADPPGQGALRLTDQVNHNNIGGEQAYAFYNFAIPSSVPLTIQFNTYAYGGQGDGGADGITFFLFDANTQNPAPGGFGGSLGYAQRQNGNTIDPGIPNAYAGIGVDEFGNFVNDAEARGTGCGTGNYAAYRQSPVTGPNPPNIRNTVTVRGPGNGTQGYCYLDSNYTNNNRSSLTTPPRAAGQPHVVTITLNPTSSTTSQIAISIDNNPVVLSTTLTGQRPSQFKLGFASSTGNEQNIHEIQNLVITALNPPLPNLTIAKTHSPISFSQGGTGTYTLSVTNTGNGATTAPVTVTDTLPAGFTYVSSTGTNWICFPSGQVVNCTYDAVAPAGQPLPNLTLTVSVSPTTAPGIYTNTATVPRDGVNQVPPNTATDQTPVLGPVSAIKTVNDLNNPNGGNAKAGDVLVYTTTITNNTSNPANSVTFQDPIPDNTSYVPGSTTLNGTAVADVNGAMPFVNAALVNSPGQPVGQITAGQAAIVTFQVKINNPLPNTVTQVANSGLISNNGLPPVSTGSTINTPFSPTIIPVNGQARLRLVKRVTNLTRNGTPIGGINFGSFVSVNADDTAPGWSQLPPVGVPSILPTTPVQSGDEVEYTVYFLSDGVQDAQNVQFCDLIPSGTTFNPDSFGPGSGISLNRAGVVRSLTNVADADEGTFFSPLAPLPAGNTCSNQNNPDGAVVVNLGTIPSAAGSNYGFVRFRTRIN